MIIIQFSWLAMALDPTNTHTDVYSVTHIAHLSNTPMSPSTHRPIHLASSQVLDLLFFFHFLYY